MMDDEVQEEMPERRVMIAVDESEESMYALQWVVDFLLIRPADNCAGGDRIIVVHAENPMALSGQVAFTPHVLEILERSQRTKTERVLSRAKAICEERNVRMETKTVIGDPRYAICEAADRLRVDVLVVGSHGHGAIKRALIGSVSDYCMHHAKCPVLVVKRQS